MFLIPCPVCGERDASEFHYHGEAHAPVVDGERLDRAAWARYLFVWDNEAGVAEEWWCHAVGCGEWFLVERDTRDNRLLRARFAEKRR